MPFNSRYFTEDDLRADGFKSVGADVRVHECVNLHGIENISLGDHVRIDAFASIVASGPVTLGNHVHIASFSSLAGGEGITFGDFAGLSQGVQVYTRSDDYTGRHLTNPTVPAQFTGVKKGAVVLGRHVIVGAGTVILPGVTIGEGTAVGALSLVTKSLEPWGIYHGNPAKFLRARSKRLLELEVALLAMERQAIVA